MNITKNIFTRKLHTYHRFHQACHTITRDTINLFLRSTCTVNKRSHISRTRAVSALKAQAHLVDLLEFELNSYKYDRGTGQTSIDRRSRKLKQLHEKIEKSILSLQKHHITKTKKRTWFELPKPSELSPTHEKILYSYAVAMHTCVSKYKITCTELRKKIEKSATNKSQIFPKYIFTLGWLRKKIHHIGRDHAFYYKKLSSLFNRDPKPENRVTGNEIFTEILRLQDHFEYVEKWNVHLSGALLDTEKFRSEILSMKQVMSQEKIGLIKFKAKLNNSVKNPSK